MAKAKSKDEPQVMKPEGFAALILGNMNKKSTSTQAYQAGDHAKFTYGVPIPSLIFQYIVGGANILPTQRIFSISGAPKSFKSTLAVEYGVWHVLDNGIFFDLDNESKTSATMLDAMTWWRLTPEQLSRVIYKETASIEEWSTMVTTILKAAEAAEIPPKNQRIPIYVGLDSLTGKTSDEAQEDLMKEGHAEARQYPVTVMQITNFLKGLSLMNTTMSFGYVRHAKKSMEANEHGKLKEAGGSEASFRSSLSIMVRKDKGFNFADHPALPHRNVSGEGYTLSMQSEMSCLGPDKRRISVDIVWQYVPFEFTEVDAEGNEVKVVRQRQIMVYDWAGALGEYLWTFCHGETKDRGYVPDQAKLKAILPFTSPTSRRVNCEILGLEAADFTEFGKAIEANPDVRAKIAAFLGIANYRDVQAADIVKNVQPEEE